MKREGESKLVRFLDRHEIHPSVLIVQGARQVGKTYLVVEALQSRDRVVSINLEKDPALKLDIDRTSNFQEFTDLLRQRSGFRPGENQVLFIDEAQESERLGTYVRQMKEDWSWSKTILSGSSMNRLFSLDTRIPVGRIEYLQVFPFSFSEFLRFQNQDYLLHEASRSFEVSDTLHSNLVKLYDGYLHFGGMPEVVKALTQQGEPDKILSFLIASQRDDFLRKEKLQSHLFMDAVKGIANHVGSTSKFSHVTPKITDGKKVIQLLLDWFIALEVEVKGSSPTQRFWPKRYLYDSGILRFVRDTAIPRISVIETLDEVLRTPLGGLVENSVLIDLLSVGGGGYTPISSWKKNNKEPVEVDFIAKTGDKTVPIEVKASLRIHQRHAKNLVAYCERFKIKHGLLVSFDKPSRMKFGPICEVENVPAYKITNYFAPSN